MELFVKSPDKYFILSRVGLSQNITCPMYKCNVLVSDSTVLELVTDSSVRRRYQHLITNSFVSCNRQLTWCPAAGCDKVIKVGLLEV